MFEFIASLFGAGTKPESFQSCGRDDDPTQHDVPRCDRHPSDPFREGFCGECLDNHIAGVHEWTDEEVADHDAWLAAQPLPDHIAVHNGVPYCSECGVVYGSDTEHLASATCPYRLHRGGNPVSTWVALSIDTQLPTFDRHNGAYAYAYAARQSDANPFDVYPDF